MELRAALIEILSDPDHQQCIEEGPEAQADCIIEGLTMRDVPNFDEYAEATAAAMNYGDGYNAAIGLCPHCRWSLKYGNHQQYDSGLWACDGHQSDCQPGCGSDHK
jgi:hypothetical protein